MNGGLRKTADSAHTILNECKAVKAGYGLARFVLAWQLRHGMVRSGEVMQVAVWQLGRGRFGFGQACYGSAVKAG